MKDYNDSKRPTQENKEPPRNIMMKAAAASTTTFRASFVALFCLAVFGASTKNFAHGFAPYINQNSRNLHNNIVGQSSNTRSTSTFLQSSEAPVASKGFGAAAPLKDAPTKNNKQEKEEDETKEDEFSNRPVAEIKEELLDLLPRMTGQEEEFRRVEQLVNALEERHIPAQTLGFLNLAMAGEWQLLFSTNIVAGGGNSPSKFRLRELFQRIETDNLEGNVTNQAVWDLAEDQDNVFDATGTFSVQCSYSINQGARMVMDLEDHVLRPEAGSKIPKDVPALVGRLHRSIPKEIFDPNDHAMDTTYLDADLRIVRMTGPRLEGVRDIFIRRGGLAIDPTNN